MILNNIILNKLEKHLEHKFYFCRLCLTLLLVSLIFFYKLNTVLADKGPTNVNQVTDFFDKELGEKQQLENFLESSKKQAEDGIGSKQAITELGSKEVELENKASELSSINANNLESKGREERSKEEHNYYDALEVDYNDPLFVSQKKDIDLIVDGSTKLIARLIEGLADIGIDCKTAKGDKEQEPEYTIEIKKEHYKDTIYNKHICEELRNQYSCNDTLAVTCKKKGTEWGEWQDKEIYVPGKELFDFGKPVFLIDRTAPRCFEYKLIVEREKLLFIKLFSGSCPNPDQLIPWMREFLATRHPGSTIENIGEQMSSSWHGGIFSIEGWNYCGQHLGYKDHLWSTYVIKYKYRDGKPVCLEWAEDWSEACKLQ